MKGQVALTSFFGGAKKGTEGESWRNMGKNDHSTPCANIRVGDGGGMFMSPVGAMASTKEEKEGEEGKAKERQCEARGSYPTRDRELMNGNEAGTCVAEAEQNPPDQEHGSRVRDPLTTPAPSRGPRTMSRGKPLSKKRVASRSAVAAAKATKPSTDPAPAATPASMLTPEPSRSSSRARNDSKGTKDAVAASFSRNGKEEEGVEVVADCPGGPQVSAPASEPDTKVSEMREDLMVISDDEGHEGKEESPAAGEGKESTLSPTGTSIASVSSTAATRPPKASKRTPTVRRKVGGEGQKAEAGGATAGSSKTKGEAPATPMEAAYQDKLEKLLAACAHRGSVESDYRVGVEEVLEAARACRLPICEGAARQQPSSTPEAAAAGMAESGPEKESDSTPAAEEGEGSEHSPPAATPAGAEDRAGQSVTGGGDRVVPEGALPLIARLVQGSPLPLSLLLREISEFATARSVSCLLQIPEDALRTKLRLLAERKAYGIKPRAAFASEDTDHQAVWRWEVVQNELLSTSADGVKAIREARAARANLGKHVRALSHLIKTIRKDPSNTALVGQAEEKVLALDRQMELVKQRQALAEKKHEERQRAVAEKAEKARSRQEEKARKKEEREQKEKERQEEKRQKEEAAAAAAAADGDDGDESGKKKSVTALDVKQPAISAFFKAKAPAPDTAQKVHPGRLVSLSGPSTLLGGLLPGDAKGTPGAKMGGETGEDGGGISDVQMAIAAKVEIMDAILKKGPMDREELLKDLRLRGKTALCTPRNPKHKAHRFQTVHVTVTHRAAEGGMWAQPEFAVLEEKRLWNAMKFLSFAEDVRPPYYGTWSRRSREVRPRHFWGKSKLLDYDYDSEEDWEEGEEDGDGENLSVTAENDREEDQDPHDGLDYTDGWLARDDEVEREDDVDGGDGEEGTGNRPGCSEDRGFVRVGVHFFDANFEAERPIVDERIRPALADLRVIPTQPGSLPIKLPYFGAPAEEGEVNPGGMGAVVGSSDTTPQQGESKGDETQEEKSSGAKNGDETGSSNGKAARGSKTLEEALVPELLKMVEGSRLGKDKITESFLRDHPKAASKAQVRTLIEKSADKVTGGKGTTAGKAFWAVKQELIDQYQLQRYHPPSAPTPPVDKTTGSKANGVGCKGGGAKAPRKRKANPSDIPTGTAHDSAATPPTAVSDSESVPLEGAPVCSGRDSKATAQGNAEGNASGCDVLKDHPCKRARKAGTGGGGKDALKGVPVLTKFFVKSAEAGSGQMVPESSEVLQRLSPLSPACTVEIASEKIPGAVRAAAPEEKEDMATDATS